MTVFPNAKVNKHSPGVTGNLIVKYGDQKAWDKKDSDGILTQYNAAELATRLKRYVAAA